MDGQELAVAALEGDIAVDATYRKYAADMEQAKIDKARETARISNIAVAQPATLEPEVVFPNRTMFLEFGVLFGLAAAVAVAYWAEARDHSFRGPEDVQRRLGVVVLATIPDYHAAELLTAARRKVSKLSISGFTNGATKGRSAAAWTLDGMIDEHCQLIWKELGLAESQGQIGVAYAGDYELS